MAIEHILATQSSSTKCLPYGCFITKIFQNFVINLVGVGDHIGLGKIYNQHTFKRMGFERNDEGLLIRGGQQRSDDDEEEDNGNEEEGNEPENMDEEETNEEDNRREMRSKKGQERTEEGQSSVDTTQIMDRIAAMKAQLNYRLNNINGNLLIRLDELDKNIIHINNQVIRLELYYIRSKRSWQLKHNEEGEIKPFQDQGVEDLEDLCLSLKFAKKCIKNTCF
ncbi:hypothetical protein M9H77_35332 [Catharanthus roseus]|uniref:Uncharacterized protein n=1 Tax=Catharanthus roseus TaxID=4058 RepID=A0ACB9ZNP1_CATRO|nr:hypothetical protein M9H77_35332 [Catharanthus roseus]